MLKAVLSMGGKEEGGKREESSGQVGPRREAFWVVVWVGMERICAGKRSESGGGVRGGIGMGRGVGGGMDSGLR